MRVCVSVPVHASKHTGFPIVFVHNGGLRGLEEKRFAEGAIRSETTAAVGMTAGRRATQENKQQNNLREFSSVQAGVTVPPPSLGPEAPTFVPLSVFSGTQVSIFTF